MDDDIVEHPLKRTQCELAIPVQTSRRMAQQECCENLKKVLADIEQVIKSQHTKIEAGDCSLQAYCARTIQSHLRMVVQNGC